MNIQAKVIVKLKHDKGTVKISTWASSTDEAKRKVCDSENAPLSSVMYAKVDKPTISDIKRLTEESAPYFFTRKTLNFFKQKMSDFSVTRYNDDMFYISARHPHGITERIFNPFTNTLQFVPREEKKNKF
jgi:hypothetical protein